MGHMNMMQNLIDGMNAQMQKARAETQMTLGQLIAALEAMPPGTAVANQGRRLRDGRADADLGRELRHPPG